MISLPSTVRSLQTTCTRNGLGTVISNRILTLDVDTQMGAGQHYLLNTAIAVNQLAVYPTALVGTQETN